MKMGTLSSLEQNVRIITLFPPVKADLVAHAAVDQTHTAKASEGSPQEFVNSL